ncbi:MAG: glucose-1-phosphate adenylyltransferase, partial [Planctomycetes bacterium]|nr:glucose-1-phosphate adenylyltransferase [Planctomycetota bacterium]
TMGWQFLHRELDEFIEVLPPQQRLDDHWYQGTADAVYQNIYSIEKHKPRYVIILSGDHIYKMDYADLIRRHVDSGAVATLACIPVPLSESRHFGVIEVNDALRVTGFVEKPEKTDPMPDDPSSFLASMGIYVFDARFLFDELCRDATDTSSGHDFGHNILPSIIDKHHVQAYPFRDRNTGKMHYWRDVGTLEAYYEANMDLVAVEPELNMYDQSWIIRTYNPPYPPAKTVFMQTEGPSRRVGEVLGSIICPGSIVSGGRVQHSIIGWNVRVNSWADVRDSILFEGVEIGRRARVRRAIIDKGVFIPPGMELGYDHAADRARGLTVTGSGIVVVGKEARFQ